MDSIGNMFTTIRNAIILKKSEVNVPYSKEKEAVSKVLKNKNVIADYYVKNIFNNKKRLVLQLKYLLRGSAKVSVISGIARVSKPGLRVNTGYKKMHNNFLGFEIISTNKGIMTSQEAKKMKIGGEILGRVW
ncbi:MAG: 30S ribosomal protein S8 [Bacilli bacterium]|nr:30S ribosomal protein S8 [Bacilli bacterium]